MRRHQCHLYLRAELLHRKPGAMCRGELLARQPDRYSNPLSTNTITLTAILTQSPAALQGAESLCASAGVTLSVSVPQSSAPVTSAPATSSPAVTATTTTSYAVQSNVTNTTTATPSVFTGA